MTGTRVEHSRQIRDLCVAKRHDGQTYQAIADGLKLRVSSVKTIVSNAKKNSHTHSLLRSGRPRKTTVRQDRQIVREAKKNRRLSAGKLVSVVEKGHGIALSKQTVRNRIKDEGLNGRAAQKKTFLSKKNIKAICPGEEFKNECLAPTFKSGRETLMVWGCITYEGVGALHMCDSNITGAYYKSILEQNLQATVSVLGIGSDYKFVQDGAPGHRARLVKDYLKEKEVELLPHPAQSPDLNPIENLWALVKQELSKRPASGVDDSKEKIQEIWYDIEPKTVQDLYHSMPKRLLQVKDNRGGHTKY
ncbi:DDE superfamily endonuclease [Phytophthora infestans]|uniref:DDE superfamily endonuclease n=1 Tax=Phytophthora infestans TaxID=4787 RepID=A0A833SVF4_PHYIN|nr:DDE superfamily endonuclease [Phytophthora infestans]